MEPDFPVFIRQDLGTTVNTTKGVDIFNSMLLSQYQASPNLIEYCEAYFIEMDYLFEQIERVYLGRFLEYATGEQLTILGIIVGISRELSIDGTYFGFASSLSSGTFGTSGDALLGEKWRSLTPEQNLIQLDDDVFSRVVRAKAMCNAADAQTVEFVYKIVAIILGQMPSSISLTATVGWITLTLVEADTDTFDIKVVEAMSEFFVPAGYIFVIDLI